MNDAGPLAGIRVLELTTGIAGQSAGMLLADLGADVVRPIDEGDADRTGVPGWLCWNRGKTVVRRGADPAAAALEVRRLVERADLLVADARPGELERLGLDATSLAASTPSLVHVWMPPFGTGGRWSQLPHDDLLLDAVTGFAAHHPATEERPVASVVPTRLQVHGAMAAGAGVAGLLARQRDGWGRSATVTGLQAVGAVLCTLVARSIDGPPMISAGKVINSGAHFRLYQGSDGRWLFLGALSPELFFKALDVLDRMEILAREEIAGEFTNLMRPDIGPAIGRELQEVFATRTTDEWLAAFGEAGVPAAPMAVPAEWLEGEIVGAACPPVRRAHPDHGEVTLPGVPVTLSATPGEVGRLPVAGKLGKLRDAWRDVAPSAVPDGDRPDPEVLPLAGLKVVDTATFLAGPLVSSLLATHGAEVVKVESLTGDPYRVFNAPYAIINEHKRGLDLDLRDEAGRATFLDLVRGADVVVDNLVPSSLQRLGLTPDVFETANPHLVRCSLTAYGQTGRWAEFPGFDPLMQTLSGLVAIQGGDGQPISTGAPVHDVAGGSVGALGTMAALFERGRHGRSQRVFTSLAAVSTFLQSGELTTFAGRPPRPTGGPDWPGPSSYRRYYRAADRWLAVSATTADQRRALLEVVGRPELADVDDAARAEALSAVFAGGSVERWVTPLAAVGVPACQVLERVELGDPFLVEQRYSHVVTTPHVGRLEVIGGFTDWRGAGRRPPFGPDDLRAELSEVIGRWSG